MGSDISRLRFDPLRDFAGVVQQQGRLSLDADFNEYVAMVDRRLRAQASDLAAPAPPVGGAAVAWVPRQTPDAFRVALAGGGLTLGRGRMYVDGLLAENHGLPPLAWDPRLAEETGSADRPYAEQPYWPTPAALPAGGPHLAYLDVWEREVTHLQQPDLVEVAVGVDTTARLQTAWQARLLPNVGGIDCDAADADIPGWLDLIAPSGGRLTTGTVELGDDEDPCELPPTGGYRGLENQTYRVVIHDGGAPGTATFKWSRDNGSVAMAVVEMVSPVILRLATVGKDEVLRVSTGDWVEIIDDNYELSGRPGVIRKVTVDDAARTLTFTDALPSDIRPANAQEAAERHLRVRRWDQSGPVRDAGGSTLVDLDAPGATGLITVPAAPGTQVVLENGVALVFSTAAGGSGEFRSGDYWVFAARVADTSVEQLVESPPAGPHHHYARLALVDFATGTVSDCRTLWPTADVGGCCTVTVGDGTTSVGTFSDIQAAVDHVRELGGGQVCVLPGTYEIDAAVRIESDDLIVSGCGLMTQITSRKGEPAFLVRGARRVSIRTLAVTSASPEATIRVLASRDVDIADCVVANSIRFGRSSDTGRRTEGLGRSIIDIDEEGAERRKQPPVGAAVAVSELEGGASTDFTLRDSLLWGLPAVSFQGLRASLRDNHMSGGGAWISDGSHDVRIEGNEIRHGEGPGILLGGLFLDELPGSQADGLARVTILNSRITGMSASGITTWGHFREPQSVYEKRRSGLGSLVVTLTVEHNLVAECARAEVAALFDPEALGGVVLREVTGLRLADNQIQDNGGELPACGVFLHTCVGSDVVDNRITGNVSAGEFEPDARPDRYQGGLIAPLVTASYDGAGEVRRDTIDGIRRLSEVGLAPGAATHALRVDGNTIVAPRGHALLVQAVGSVSVANSLLASHDVAPQPPTSIGRQLPLTWLGVCLRIINLGVGLDGTGESPLGQARATLLRGGVPLDGRVLVHGNQIQLRIPDGSPFFEDIEKRGPSAAVGLLSNDDVSFQDNQVVLYARPTLG